MTLSEVFSITSLTAASRESPRQLQDSKYSESQVEFWTRSLQDGVESDHHCQHMFDTLEVIPRFEGNSFEIVLDPDGKQSMPYDESSASNVNCVISLIVGLAVDPHVVDIGVGGELKNNNIRAQWITQSNEDEYRPFFSRGLKGDGQIVAVSDGGLDADSCYFQDDGGDGSIYDGNWDFSRRKIVNYDNTFADNYDEKNGHGTHVAGTIAGKKSTNGKDEEDGEADGIAPNAKISFFDMAKQDS
eukprot:3511696-Ditylum_brightwellii.AAC.1